MWCVALVSSAGVDNNPNYVEFSSTASLPQTTTSTTYESKPVLAPAPLAWKPISAQTLLAMETSAKNRFTLSEP